jgi:hypothetical protein
MGTLKIKKKSTYSKEPRIIGYFFAGRIKQIRFKELEGNQKVTLGTKMSPQKV